jgi:hypothetical protein
MRCAGEGKEKENRDMICCVDRVMEKLAKRYIIMTIQNSYLSLRYGLEVSHCQRYQISRKSKDSRRYETFILLRSE